MDSQLGWAFVVALFAVPVACFLILDLRKRFLMHRLSALLQATYHPRWISFGASSYGTIDGDIHGRSFKVWVISGKNFESMHVQLPCNAPALEMELAGNSVSGNFHTTNIFPAEIVDACRELFAGQEFLFAETAMMFAKGRITFIERQLEWRSQFFFARNPERFALMIPLLATIATCLEKADIQRRFIAMVQK
jgi:hypothetical protein